MKTTVAFLASAILLLSGCDLVRGVDSGLTASKLLDDARCDERGEIETAQGTRLEISCYFDVE